MKRGARGMSVTALPYTARVYINNQVLIPANVARVLGLTRYNYACFTIEYKGFRVSFRAKLLRHRQTDSIQFTIPRWVRVAYGIEPLDVVRVVSIEPGNGCKEAPG